MTINYSNFKQINYVSVTDRYKSVFAERLIGSTPGKVHINIESSTPVQCPPHRVPLAINSALKEELEMLVQKGVIVPEYKPTELCSQNIRTKETIRCPQSMY